MRQSARGALLFAVGLAAAMPLSSFAALQTNVVERHYDRVGRPVGILVVRCVLATPSLVEALFRDLMWKTWGGEVALKQEWNTRALAHMWFGKSQFEYSDGI